MINTRIPFETQMRAAAVELLTDFGSEFDLNLQVYPARPRSIKPPCAFVDKIAEAISFDGLRQRVVSVSVVVLHGLFASADTAAQRDAFIDNFVDWTSDRFHAAGGSTVIEPRTVEDDPAYQAEWTERQETYFATIITLEGFNGSGY